MSRPEEQRARAAGLAQMMRTKLVHPLGELHFSRPFLEEIASALEAIAREPESVAAIERDFPGAFSMIEPRPAFLTFTGADDDTDPAEMLALSKRYPVEWGILFSPSKQGTSRYPSMSWVAHFLGAREEVGGIFQTQISAHICGAHSRDLLHYGACEHDDLIRTFFERAQVNSSATDINWLRVAEWGKKCSVEPILQCRDRFPGSTLGISYLFDASGGRGISPSEWPVGLHTLCGYAGGLRPENVAEALKQIRLKAANFWLDMETGVRDEQGRFSIDRCRQVCEIVYPNL